MSQKHQLKLPSEENKLGEQKQVADHDFTRFSVIPSVALVNEIPSEISGSWFTGKVHVLYKEGAFEPSPPVRHSTELCNMLQEKATSSPILFLYSDGDPDHRITYMSVKLALTWRLVYAKHKLTSAEKQAMEVALDGLSFSCGSELQNADISPDMKDVVCVKKLQCNEPVEKLSKPPRYLHPLLRRNARI